MKVIEYLQEQKNYQDITFIITTGDLNRTTPIRTAEEWMDSNNDILEYVILNHKQPPIGWGGAVSWIDKYNRGILKCLLITSEEVLKKQYPREEQYLSLLDMVDREARK